MKEPPQNVSATVRKLNPHLYASYQEKVARLGQGYVTEFCGPLPPHAKATQSDSVATEGIKTPKRIRQSTKPLMNKLEQEYFDQLCTHHIPLYPQSITFKIANGVRYTPDIFCFAWPWRGENMPVAWEIKGPWMTDDAVVKLKVFANAYPHIKVLLASKNKETGLWFNQEVWG